MPRVLIGMGALALIVAATTVGEAQNYRRAAKVRPKVSAPKPALRRSFDVRVVRRHMPALRYCYDRQRRRDPKLGSGRVTGELVINAAGAVVSAAAKGPSPAWREVDRCVAHSLRRMRFRPDKAGGSISVRLPLFFDSGATTRTNKPSAARRKAFGAILRGKP